MEFAFTEEQKELRRRFRDFIKKEMPPEVEDWSGTYSTPESLAMARTFERRMAEAGWLAVAWPKEYGGGGFTFIEQAIVNEEKGYHGVPTVNGTGLNLAGPSLMIHGTEEQKQKYLPPMTRGEVVWAQGFTEPGAGSDLAALSTRAVQDGDDYVINGQKIFTSAAHVSDYIYLATRTDPDAPKHRGISLFVVPTDAPGVTVRPLWMTGSYSGGKGVNQIGNARNNEVFFDDVRVPATEMIGEKDRGWYVMATTLDFERSGVGGVASKRRDFDELVEYCIETKVGGQRLIDVPKVKKILGDIGTRLEVLHLLCWRVIWMQSQGIVPNSEASEGRLFEKSYTSWFARQAMAILGPMGPLLDSKWAPLAGRIAGAYVPDQSVHAAGHSNIQRNIIANRGLGLPR